VAAEAREEPEDLDIVADAEGEPPALGPSVIGARWQGAVVVAVVLRQVHCLPRGRSGGPGEVDKPPAASSTSSDPSMRTEAPPCVHGPASSPMRSSAATMPQASAAEAASAGVRRS